MEYEIVRMERGPCTPDCGPGTKLAFPDPWSESSVASELENPLSLWLVAQAGGAGPGLCGQPDGDWRGGYDEFGRGLPAARRQGDRPGAGDGALIRELAGGGVHQPDPGGPGLQWAGQGAVWEPGLCPGGLPPGVLPVAQGGRGRFSERSGIYDTDGRGILLRRDRCGPGGGRTAEFSQTASPPRWICTGFTGAWCRKLRPVSTSRPFTAWRTRPWSGRG